MITSLPAIKHKHIKRLLENCQNSLFDVVRIFGPVVHLIFPEIFEKNLHEFQGVFIKAGIIGGVHYAVKSNKSESILEIVAKNGAGVEVSSIWELQKSLSHGIVGERIICSGPGKTAEFLILATLSGAVISLDSPNELNYLLKIVKKIPLDNKRKARVLVRLGEIAKTTSRFGVLDSDLDKLHKILLLNKEFIQLEGYSFHLDGYSITERQIGTLRLIEQIRLARKLGFDCKIIDIGGGFAINYLDRSSWQNFINHPGEVAFHGGKSFNRFYPYYTKNPKVKFLKTILNKPIPDEPLPTIAQILRNEGIVLFVEPGRALLDQAGITLMQIKDVKCRPAGENIVVVGGNINHLSEQWFNTDFLPDPVLLTNQNPSRNNFITSIGGNTCMESDMLSWKKTNLGCIPTMGDILVFINTAGYQMDSNESTFQSIPIPPKLVLYKINNDNFEWCTDATFTFWSTIKS